MKETGLCLAKGGNDGITSFFLFCRMGYPAPSLGWEAVGLWCQDAAGVYR